MTFANLFLGTVRLWRSTMISWPLGLFLYIVFTGWLVGLIKESYPIEEIIASMPQAVAALFIGDSTFNALSTDRARFLLAIDANFLGTGPIYAALFALYIAPAIAMRDRERGTLDTLLARPLSRRTYVVTRLVAFAAVTAVVGISILVSHALAIGLIGGYQIPWLGLMAVTLAWCLLALGFGTFGFFVAVARLSVGAGMAATLILLLAMVTLNLVGLAWKEAEPIAELSVFKQWRPLEMLMNETLRTEPFLLYGGVSLLGGAAAIVAFERRDLA